MKTLLSEIKRLRLARVDRINKIEQSIETKRVVLNQLNKLYKNPIENYSRIAVLENKVGGLNV